MSIVKVEISVVSLAGRLRKAAQDMAEENCHDWAFLAEIAAEALLVSDAERAPHHHIPGGFATPPPPRKP